MKLPAITFLLSLAFLTSCIDKNPNLTEDGEDIIQSQAHYVDASIQNYQDTVYVPVYSNIYSDTRSKSLLLTATLSIRSTSLTDTTYINAIDYYDTSGKLVRSFLEKTLVLNPLQSIDYVIPRDDTSGGSGANFLVMWGGQIDTKPLFQCVMLGTTGQYGYAFTSDGYSVKNSK